MCAELVVFIIVLRARCQRRLKPYCCNVWELEIKVECFAAIEVIIEQHWRSSRDLIISRLIDFAQYANKDIIYHFEVVGQNEQAILMGSNFNDTSSC
jgi:hypothetical protein